MTVEPVAYVVPLPSLTVFQLSKVYPVRVRLLDGIVFATPGLVLIAVGTVPEPPLASNVIVTGAVEGIGAATDTVTDSPVQEPDDDFTLACIVTVVSVSILLKVSKLELIQTTVVAPSASVLHVPVYVFPPIFSVPEYEAVTDELTLT